MSFFVYALFKNVECSFRKLQNILVVSNGVVGPQKLSLITNPNIIYIHIYYNLTSFTNDLQTVMCSFGKL